MIMMYKWSDVMHRTQIYFEETMFEMIKQKAGALNVSVSAYIRDTLKKELEAQQDSEESIDFSDFAGLWEDADVTQDSIRKKAWDK